MCQLLPHSVHLTFERMDSGAQLGRLGAPALGALCFVAGDLFEAAEDDAADRDGKDKNEEELPSAHVETLFPELIQNGMLYSGGLTPFSLR